MSNIWDFQDKERHLNLSINYFCNQKCLFCSDWDKKDLSFINKYTYKSFKEYIYKNKDLYNEIIFTSWEPTLNKDLFKYAEYAKECWYKKLSIITNWSTLINNNIRKNIIKYFDNITISLHWSNSVLHDKLTWVIGAFNRTIKGIILLIKEKEKNNIIISFVLNSENLDNLYNSIHLFIFKLWVDKVLINTLRPDWDWLSKFLDLSIRYSDFVNYVSNLSNDKKNLFKNLINSNKLIITDIPLCILFKSFSIWFEWINLLNVYWKMEIVSSNWINNEIKITNNTEDKKYCAKCNKCLYKNNCEGIFKRYLEVFWEGEIWM